jgi:hypothetical protein
VVGRYRLPKTTWQRDRVSQLTSALGWWVLPYALESGRVVVTSRYHLYYCLSLGSVDGSDAVASELKFNCLNMNLTI